MLLRCPPCRTPCPSFCWGSPLNKQKKAAHPYIRLTRHPSEIWFDPYTAQLIYVVRGIFCFPCRQSPWACLWQGYNSSLKQLDHHRSTRTQWGGKRVFSVQLFGNRVPGWAEHIYLCLPTSTPSAMNSTSDSLRSQCDERSFENLLVNPFHYPIGLRVIRSMEDPVSTFPPRPFLDNGCHEA